MFNEVDVPKGTYALRNTIAQVYDIGDTLTVVDPGDAFCVEKEEECFYIKDVSAKDLTDIFGSNFKIGRNYNDLATGQNSVNRLSKTIELDMDEGLWEWLYGALTAGGIFIGAFIALEVGSSLLPAIMAALSVSASDKEGINGYNGIETY